MAVAVVTGGNKGIGFFIAKQLLGRYDVVIACRDLERGQKAAKELGCRSMQLDLDDPRSIEAFVSNVRSEFGKLEPCHVAKRRLRVILSDNISYEHIIHTCIMLCTSCIVCHISIQPHSIVLGVELRTLETCQDGPKDCLVNNAGIFYTNSDPLPLKQERAASESTMILIVFLYRILEICNKYAIKTHSLRALFPFQKRSAT